MLNNLFFKLLKSNTMSCLTYQQFYFYNPLRVNKFSFLSTFVEKYKVKNFMTEKRFVLVQNDADILITKFDNKRIIFRIN
jgi:hypothetical protein